MKVIDKRGQKSEVVRDKKGEKDAIEAVKGAKKQPKIKCPNGGCKFVAKAPKFIYNKEISLNICPRCGVAFMNKGILGMVKEKMTKDE